MGLYNSRKSVWERKKNNLIADNCGVGTPDDTPKVEEIKTEKTIVENVSKSISDPVKKNKNIPQNLPEDDK